MKVSSLSGLILLQCENSLRKGRGLRCHAGHSSLCSAGGSSHLLNGCRAWCPGSHTARHPGPWHTGVGLLGCEVLHTHTCTRARPQAFREGGVCCTWALKHHRPPLHLPSLCTCALDTCAPCSASLRSGGSGSSSTGSGALCHERHDQGTRVSFREHLCHCRVSVSFAAWLFSLCRQQWWDGVCSPV